MDYKFARLTIVAKNTSCYILLIKIIETKNENRTIRRTSAIAP